MLAALADPTHEQHAELKEWVGGDDLAPQYFDPADVNAALRKIFGRGTKPD